MVKPPLLSWAPTMEKHTSEITREITNFKEKDEEIGDENSEKRKVKTKTFSKITQANEQRPQYNQNKQRQSRVNEGNLFIRNFPNCI